MSSPKKHQNKKQMHQNRQEEDESGSGGQSGNLEFKDFLAPSASRDDLLSVDEKKRLLSNHKDTHELRVKKQKELLDLRKQLKEGKIDVNQYKQGMGRNNQYQINHPILSNKAQFSGIDRQVNALPSENMAETNEDKRNELDYQYRLRYMPENAPRFNPKPQYR